MTSIKLNGDDITKKREEIKNYFLETFSLFEKIFDYLKDDSVFYKQSEKTRHAMIFYYGHTAVFYINKLILAKVIDKRINEKFESLFAVGVDEMEWDDLDYSKIKWPKVSEVREYRKKVKEVVLDVIDHLNFSLPITWDSPMWAILMGIEHERIHIETSLVLHRQMPIEFVKDIKDFRYYFSDECKDLETKMVKIPKTKVKLGKSFEDDTYYGWDNEYGEFEVELDEFYVANHLVTNEEFMEFVKDGGYENKEFWDEEGWEFITKNSIKHPPFWVKTDNGFLYRYMAQITPMPKNFPVEVSNLEAMAYVRYRSKKDKKDYTLMSEAEYIAMWEYCNLGEVITKEKANHDFKFASSTPASMHAFETKSGDVIYDVVGNVWQHSKTPIRAFKGFKTHPLYDDFTTPTLDEKHNLILGSSWASSGNLILKHSRYAFRRHFYQHAGFRLAISNNKDKTNYYEQDEVISEYLEFHYSNNKPFGVENFLKNCVNEVIKYTANKNVALDIGCAVGRASFELARYFNKVVGIDFSARFIQEGVKLKNEGKISWNKKIEGDIKEQKSITLKELGLDDIKEKVEFWQGDACNLKPFLKGYDLVLALNLIDRLYNPKLFLEDIKGRINKGGILAISSPYTWQEVSTPKENWLGGYYKDNKPVYTIDTLKDILKESFELIQTKDIEFVIPESKRKHQHTISHLTIWRKISI